MESNIHTKTRSLLIYFGILVLLCAGFMTGARLLGQSGAYLAGGSWSLPAFTFERNSLSSLQTN